MTREQGELKHKLKKLYRKYNRDEPKYRQETLDFISKAQAINTEELDQLQQAIIDSETQLRGRIQKLDEDRTMLKKLIAMQMENQALEKNQQDSNDDMNNDMAMESQESSKNEEDVNGRPRIVMKKFQNVLLKTYKNDNDN